MVRGICAGRRGVVRRLRIGKVGWLPVDGGALLGRGRDWVGLGWVVALALRDKALLQAINTLQKGLENVCLGTPLLGYGICRAHGQLMSGCAQQWGIPYIHGQLKT